MKLLLLLLLPQIALASLQIPTKEFQFQASLNAVIGNSTRPDVRPGMVVASPSRQNPNYYFDWVRDTALTMRSLIDLYDAKRDPKLKKLILTWIDAEIFRQTLPTMTGLGEPKFNVDGSGYTGPWGRPQNDGPALRAISIIRFARILLRDGEQDYVIKKLYNSGSVIKKDLEYTAREWTKPNFDLWEEVKGMHFYTLLVQHTALQEGAKMAREFRDDEAASRYEAEANKIARGLVNRFLDPNVGIRTTVDRVEGIDYKTSNLDAAPMLALLHTYPYQKLFGFNHPQVRKYIDTLALTFAKGYEVNKALPDLGVGIGRYPEDRYDGNGTSLGNPWFLLTLGLGEYMCLLRNEVRTDRMDQMIEKQFQRALFHSDRRGHMSEQFNQRTGHMQGAVDLTWSHNAFLTAMMRCH